MSEQQKAEEFSSPECWDDQRSDSTHDPGPGHNNTTSSESTACVNPPCHGCRRQKAKCKGGFPCIRCVEKEYFCSVDPDLAPVSMAEIRLRPTTAERKKTINLVKNLEKKNEKLASTCRDLQQAITNMDTQLKTKEEELFILLCQHWQLMNGFQEQLNFTDWLHQAHIALGAKMQEFLEERDSPQYPLMAPNSP